MSFVVALPGKTIGTTISPFEASQESNEPAALPAGSQDSSEEAGLDLSELDVPPADLHEAPPVDATGTAREFPAYLKRPQAQEGAGK
eukprot:scaffold521500_cov19-Prasinocladus_malaysianus.AAC.1